MKGPVKECSGLLGRTSSFGEARLEHWETSPGIPGTASHDAGSKFEAFGVMP